MHTHKPMAILTVRDAANLSKASRKDIAEWLRRLAKDVVREGHNFSKRFTARIYGAER